MGLHLLIIFNRDRSGFKFSPIFICKNFVVRISIEINLDSDYMRVVDSFKYVMSSNFQTRLISFQNS